MDFTMSARETAAQYARVSPLNTRRGDNRITVRQRKILDCIREALDTNGYPPSMREIGAKVHLTSPSSVKYQLQELERKGYIRRDPRRPRALELVEDRDLRETQHHGNSLHGGASALANGSGMATVSDLAAHRDARYPAPAYVPWVGQIAAGGPIIAEQATEDVFPLPRQLVGEGDLFTLKVRGDSMIDAAICDGDWVVVRQQKVAENGEMVAALLGEEATVKTLKKDGSNIWLMPQNAAYEPIPGNEAIILGKVVSVLRSV
ncbi:MAG: transcriptional repressor LexA [Cellulomonadaceae bacterium]|jgi:repressor LexA|nr:transcriptional repressor LexA [Cellulomonadaceae bacterium]